MIRILRLFLVLTLVFISGPVTAYALTASRDTVRTYDEQVNQLNAVDFSQGPITVADYTTRVAQAWDNGMGGVIDFETADPPTDTKGIDRIEASFAGGSKTLVLVNGDSSGWVPGTLNTGGAFPNRTPISGIQILGKGTDTSLGQVLTNDFVFDLSGALVDSIGATILSRKGRAFPNIEVKAVFDNGDMVNYPVSIEAGQDITNDPVAGDQDTFVALEAPARTLAC